MNYWIKLTRESQSNAARLIAVALLVAIVIVTLFTLLAYSVMKGDTQLYDVAVLESIRGLRSPALNDFFIFVTQFGGVLIVTAATTALVIYLAYRRYTSTAIFVALGVSGAAGMNQIMKQIFERVRPDHWQQLIAYTNFSFPSGHATASAALALVIVLLLWRSRWRSVALFGGLFYIVLIGLSRLYLNVHYLTDILGGWLAAIAWVGIVGLIIWNYARRTAVRKIVILYNPNSSGDSHNVARRTKEQIIAKAKEQKRRLMVEIKATEYAGHGEYIAADYARSRRPVTILSASGDGGYNEIINGALSHRLSRVVTGVLPGGNANDHYHATHSEQTIERIVSGYISRLDVLRVQSYLNGVKFDRFAHSYAGLGISARVTQRIEKSRPGLIAEKGLVMHALLSFRHTTLIVNGQRNHYSSLTFSNIGQMSKVMKLSKKSVPDDGYFEVNAIRFKSKLHLLLHVIKATTFGLDPAVVVKKYTVHTVRSTPIQLDGEFFLLDQNSKITVSSEKQWLRCVL